MVTLRTLAPVTCGDAAYPDREEHGGVHNTDAERNLGMENSNSFPAFTRACPEALQCLEAWGVTRMIKARRP